MSLKSTPYRSHSNRHQHKHGQERLDLHHRYLKPLHLLIVILTFPFYSTRFSRSNGRSHQKIHLPFPSLSTPTLLSRHWTGSTMIFMTLSTYMVAECAPLQLPPRGLLDINIDPETIIPDNPIVGVLASPTLVPRSTSSSNPSSHAPSSPNPANSVASPTLHSATTTTTTTATTATASTSAGAATAHTTTRSQSLPSSVGIPSQGKVVGCINPNNNCGFGSTNAIIGGPQTGVPYPNSLQSGSTVPGSSPFSDSSPDNGGGGHGSPVSPVMVGMVLMSVGLAVGIMIAGVVVLKRRRQRGQENDEDYIPYQAESNSLSSTGTKSSEPRQQEQFWNP